LARSAFNMPPEPEAPRSREEETAARKGGCWKSFLGLVGFTLLFVFAYWLMLRGAEGDYLLSPQFVEVSELSARPLPAIHAWRFGARTLSGTYWVSPGELHVVDPLGNAARSAAGGYEVTRSLSTSNASENLYAWGGLQYERYPLASLERICRALHSSSYADAVVEAKALVARFPDRLAPRYWLVASLAKAGDEVEARLRLDAWRPEFEASTHPWASRLLALMESDVQAASPVQQEFRREKDRLFGAWPISPARASSLDEQTRWIAEQRLRPPRRLYSLDAAGGDYFPLVTAVRCAAVRAIQLGAVGERTEAFHLACGAYAISCSGLPGREQYSSHFSLNYAFIGLSSLKDILVHGESDPVWLESRWSDLDALFSMSPSPTDPMMDASIGQTDYADPLGPPRSRAKRAQAEVQLLREGVRARLYRSLHGIWPELGARFSPTADLRSNASPAPFDPFDPRKGPLRAVQAADGLLLYSVGADQVDGLGLVEQREWPGSIRYTPGDIILLVENEPRYRFPDEPGYVYQGMDDYNARYPKGMPLDPFSNGGSSPLRLSDDGTFRLWSFGPDADEGRGPVPDPARHLLWRYDPTNGTTSVGDIWVELPMAAAGSEIGKD
jgi:hypothetical protein